MYSTTSLERDISQEDYRQKFSENLNLSFVIGKLLIYKKHFMMS